MKAIANKGMLTTDVYKFGSGKIAEINIPNFSMKLPDVVHYGLFKEYYGKVTSVEVYNTLRGFVVVVNGYYKGVFGDKPFSRPEEDCFAGGDPYIAYFKTEEDAYERKQKVMNKDYIVI